MEAQTLPDYEVLLLLFFFHVFSSELTMTLPDSLILARQNWSIAIY